MKVTEYMKCDAVKLASLLEKKEVTQEEVIEASFSRLDEVESILEATTYTRKEKALHEVEEVEARPFRGVPLYLKDSSQAIAGELIQSGATLLQDQKAHETANFVKALYKAGFVSVGQSKAPEFSLKNITEPILYGSVCNPWNVAHSPGGSSGGAAALVASGVVPIAGASDGGGSIRIPASFTSLIGLKPTRGRTPVGPGVGRQWHGAAIDFLLTRSVRDTARALDELQCWQPSAAFHVPLYKSGYEASLKKETKKRYRIGFTTESPVDTPVSEEAVHAVVKTVKYLEEEGHIVEEVTSPVEGKELMYNYYMMNSGEMAALFRQLEQQLGRSITRDDVELEAWLLAQAGEQVSAADFSLSLASWDIAAEKMATFHEIYDFYVTPTTAYPAPQIGELTYTESEMNYFYDKIEQTDGLEKVEVIDEMFLPSLTYTPFTQLANLTGQPAISLPLHLTKDGLPLGVQFVANKGDEHRLLQIASKLEQSPLWIGLTNRPLTLQSN